MENYNKKVKQFKIDKELSIFIKGLAIILMIIHHSFGFPEWYIETISYPELQQFTKYIAQCTKLCVALFAFLTGYVYAFNKNKSYKYSLKKIFIFLVDYWIVYIILLIIAILIGGYTPSIKDIFLEMFALKTPIMKFCWYVFFYWELMLIMPIFTKIISNKNFLKELLYSILGFFIMSVLIHLFNIESNYTTIIAYFPVVICGYLCAKYDILNIVYQFLLKFKKIIRQFIGGILIILALIIHTFIPFVFGINIGVICAPIMIFGVVLMNLNKNKYINKVISFLGKYSMNIWFLHCIFYSDYTKEIFQPIAYLFHTPILVVIWILFISSIPSILISKIQEKLNKNIKKIYKR